MEYNENAQVSDTINENKNLLRETIVFLSITFILTYVSNFFVLYMYGPISRGAQQWLPALMLQMLYPAVSAIICQFIFKDKKLTTAAKIFLGYFLLFFAVSLIRVFYNPIIISNSPLSPNGMDLYQLLCTILGPLGLILLLVLNIRKAWRDGLKSLKLSFGQKGYYYLIIPISFGVLLFIDFYLNNVLGFGLAAIAFDIKTFAITLLLGLLSSVIFSWMFFFGEEYGWRVYLQDRLIKLCGRTKGVLLVGLIWGIWHAPVIAMGYNYPGHPVLGVALMTIFTIIIGIIFSFAVFKTKSVWVAVLLHMVTNVGASAAVMYISNPVDSVFSFGMGLYGLAFIGIFVCIILLISKEWRRTE